MGCHLRLIPTVSTVLMLQRYILFFNNKQIIKKKHHAPQYLKQYFASLPEKILPYAAGIIVETTTEYFKLSSSATHHGQVLHSDCCDLLENFYLCGIKHNQSITILFNILLWFAWKFLSLWYQTQQAAVLSGWVLRLWFAWKFLSLWYQTQLYQL